MRRDASRKEKTGKRNIGRRRRLPLTWVFCKGGPEISCDCGSTRHQHLCSVLFSYPCLSQLLSTPATHQPLGLAFLPQHLNSTLPYAGQRCTASWPNTAPYVPAASQPLLFVPFLAAIPRPCVRVAATRAPANQHSSSPLIAPADSTGETRTPLSTPPPSPPFSAQLFCGPDRISIFSS